jgi:hypothetical protein
LFVLLLILKKQPFFLSSSSAFSYLGGGLNGMEPVLSHLECISVKIG